MAHGRKKLIFISEKEASERRETEKIIMKYTRVALCASAARARSLMINGRDMKNESEKFLRCESELTHA
jgi:hypothetical protein